MKKFSLVKALIIVLGISLLGHYFILLRRDLSSFTKDRQQTAKAAHYYCPMHPSVTSDRPDNCPVCGMSLQVEDQPRAGTKPTKVRTILSYRHPMGKNVTSPVPMKDEMGMDFIPVYEDEAEDNQTPTLEGRIPVLLSEANQQLIGVKKAKVEKETVNYEIKASGRVAFDPDLYSAIAEYRVARETARLTQNTSETVKESSEALVSSSRLKLELMGFTDEQVTSLEGNKFDAKSLLLPEGKVWVYADVYEYELPYLKMGQIVSAESPLFPTQKFEGQVVSISPIITAATRTVNVKAEVSDPSRLLKPNMFLTVRIQASLGEQLVVPEDSVIHTGDINLVFRIDQSGRFEPTKVELGTKSKGKFIISSGLSAGDTVASAANFLIDSESRLRAVVQNALSSQSNSKEQ